MSLTDENVLNTDDNPQEDLAGDDEYMEEVVDAEEFIDPNEADLPDVEATTVVQEKSVDDLVTEPFPEEDEV